jgi:hypothetical protein
MGGINVGALKGALGAEFFARGVSGFVKFREAPRGGGMGRLGFPSRPAISQRGPVRAVWRSQRLFMLVIRPHEITRLAYPLLTRAQSLTSVDS